MPRASRKFRRRVRGAVKLYKEVVTLRNMPQIAKELDEIGFVAVQRSKLTKEYQDRTGLLKDNHFHVALGPGERKVEYFINNNGTRLPKLFKAGKTQVRLHLGARPFYAYYVETVHGLRVVSQELEAVQRDILERVPKFGLKRG